MEKARAVGKARGLGQGGYIGGESEVGPGFKAFGGDWWRKGGVLRVIGGCQGPVFLGLRGHGGVRDAGEEVGPEIMNLESAMGGWD